MIYRILLVWLLGLTLSLAQPARHAMMAQFTPNLVLDFTRGNLPAGVSFNRNSLATRYNASGLIETVNAGVPRISYNPATLACVGLLLEESRTNLLTQSADFSNWSQTNIGLTPNAGTAPDGTNTAVKMVEQSNDGFHFISRGVSYNSSSTYTYSFFAKAGTRSIVSVQMEFANNGFSGANIDLTNGAVTLLIGGSSAPQIVVTPINNGWYRFSVTSSNNTHGGDRLLVSIRQNGTQDATYQGDGSYLYIWGAQFEEGSFFSSYIPTQGDAVTRAADTYSVSVGELYNRSEGAFVCRFSTDVPGVDLRPLLASDGTAGNQLVVQRSANNQLGGYGTSGGTAITLGTLTGQSTGTMSVGLAYRGSNDYQLAANNILPAPASNAVSAPLVTTLSNQPTGRLWLQKVVYYPHRQSSPYLQSLTR